MLTQPFLLSKHKSRKNELDLEISRERKLIPVTESFASNVIVCMVKDIHCLCALELLL